MYTKQNRIISNKNDLSNYIEGVDVYNSELLLKLQDPRLNRDVYEVTVYQFRPDLIAKDYYGSESYMGLVIVQNGMGLEKYTKGTFLSLIKKTDLDNIINGM